ncbi:hypothetical protein GW17_00045785 [Ensete ventricosum]|nr:hypothetical protein GW17_00045785 [Ensete ventricosum]
MGMADVSIDSREEGWEVYGKKSKNRAGSSGPHTITTASGPKPWGSSPNAPRSWGQSDGVPRQRWGANGGTARTSGSNWAQANASHRPASKCSWDLDVQGYDYDGESRDELTLSSQARLFASSGTSTFSSARRTPRWRRRPWRSPTPTSPWQPKASRAGKGTPTRLLLHPSPLRSVRAPPLPFSVLHDRHRSLQSSSLQGAMESIPGTHLHPSNLFSALLGSIIFVSSSETKIAGSSSLCSTASESMYSLPTRVVGVDSALFALLLQGYTAEVVRHYVIHGSKSNYGLVVTRGGREQFPIVALIGVIHIDVGEELIGEQRRSVSTAPPASSTHWRYPYRCGGRTDRRTAEERFYCSTGFKARAFEVASGGSIWG